MYITVSPVDTITILHVLDITHGEMGVGWRDGQEKHSCIQTPSERERQTDRQRQREAETETETECNWILVVAGVAAQLQGDLF